MKINVYIDFVYDYSCICACEIYTYIHAGVGPFPSVGSFRRMSRRRRVRNDFVNINIHIRQLRWLSWVSVWVTMTMSCCLLSAKINSYTNDAFFELNRKKIWQ